MNTALILVDIQNDYFSGGKMELVGIDQASANAAKLLKYFRSKKLPTFHIQHFFTGPDAPFFEKGTEGADIHQSIAPIENETVIQKAYPNSFQKTDLDAKLKAAGIEQVLICGAMSHMCIDATTRAAADLGYKCHLAHDACATCDLEFNGVKVSADKVQASYMAALGWGYANVGTTEEILSIF